MPPRMIARRRTAAGDGLTAAEAQQRKLSAQRSSPIKFQKPRLGLMMIDGKRVAKYRTAIYGLATMPLLDDGHYRLATIAARLAKRTRHD